MITQMTEPSSLHSKVQILDQDTVNQIAAGEVIENSAGIIRELLDNAIDAGAKHIQIRVNFSDFFIEVLDDGCGIHPDDVELAFEKHATSKIKNFKDIYFTSTLGFRGEALASLASVSEVIIETAIGNDGLGIRYRIRGGKKVTLEKIACNRGTRIQVRDLFFNTPVRKKFLILKNKPLKNSENSTLELKPGEKKNIKQEIICHILAQDGIGFQYFILDKNEKLEINIPAQYTLKDKILMFFKGGGSLNNALLPVKNTLNGFSIEGYITDLSIREYRSDKQFLIIKDRVVKDPSFLKAVITAYLHKIPRGSHPMIFLRVKLDQSDDVDINVHPRKEQVKFQNPRLFFDTIKNTIKHTLSLSFLESGRNPMNYSNITFKKNSRLSLADDNSPSTISFDLNSLRKAQEQFHNHSQIHEPFTVSDKERESKRQKLFTEEELPSSSRIIPDVPETPKTLTVSDETPIRPISPDLPLVVLGQIADTFIIFSIGDDLYVTDQHAAHERINYDQLLKKIHNPKDNGIRKKVDTQMLLIPILIEKDPVEKESILLQQKTLDQLGFEVEDFGTGTLRINRVPAYLPENKIEKIVKSLIEMIALRSQEESLDPSSVDAQEFLGDMIATMACRMSIMAGDRLSHTAMEEIVREVYNKGYILTCPHGRPFVKKISLKEMRLFFDRGRHILGNIET